MSLICPVKSLKLINYFIQTIKVKPKRRGRPPINKTLSRLRCRTWLFALQSRCGGKNNCQLDLLFAPDSPEGKWEPATRPKIFEAVKNGSMPSDGTRKNRNYDLIGKVEAEPGYEGSAAIIHSPFWRLMEDKKLSLSEIRLMVIECVDLLALAKQSGNYIDDGESELDDLVASNPELTLEEYFERQKLADYGYDLAMGDAFLFLEPSLDIIALIGALAVEAIYAGNMTIAEYQIAIFKNRLEEFCRQPWLDKFDKEANKPFGNHLYDYAEKRMLEILNEDALNGLPDYVSMLSKKSEVNINSAISALLIRHQRLLWRK